jgi:cell division protease FtsH
MALPANIGSLAPVTSPSAVVQPKVVSNAAQRFPTFIAPSVFGHGKMRYDVFLKNVESHRVSKTVIRQDQRFIDVDIVDEGTYTVILPEGYDVTSYLLKHDAPVEVRQTAPQLTIIDVAILTVQLVVLRYIIGMAMSNKKMTKPVDKPNVTFQNVAGISNAKRDLMEVVEYLKNADKYVAVGAKVPRGVLLVGGPGVGKTLLAKAVAGEAGVPFFSCSGSDFMEMFVGVGASRLRELFKNAAKKAPCILFIDEIDSIGKKRGTNSMGGNDERDQTLNQLLTLMDGFEEKHGVIVMAATNRVELLDDALLRPGRFDRKIYVEVPNSEAREDILRIHTTKMPLDNDVNLAEIAASTTGFTGADLQNLANEAAIQAVRSSSTVVNKKHWDAAFDKIILGDPKIINMNVDVKRQIAYHEAGHALVGILVNDYDNLTRISVVPRGQTGGVTLFQPLYDVDSTYLTREYLENKLMVMLGGRIAEDLVYGYLKVTTGAMGDFQEVVSLAYDMVARYGFNQNLGPGAWELVEGNEFNINQEVQQLVKRSYRRARVLVRRNIKYLHILADGLMIKDTLDINDVRELLTGLSCCVKPPKKRNG